MVGSEKKIERIGNSPRIFQFFPVFMCLCLDFRRWLVGAGDLGVGTRGEGLVSELGISG
jgi:hypothetical protein